VIPLGEVEEPVLGGPAHRISPAADSDPGIIGGPIESLVVTAGSSSAYGTAPPASGTTITLTPPSRSGAHPGEGLTPPGLHRWDTDVNSTPVPAVPAGVRLWSGRKLYSAGVTVTHSVAVSGLAAEDNVRLHPDELGRIGVASGASVRVTSARGSVTLPVSADKAIPPGVAWMPPGSAADLIDAGTVMTVNLEAAGG
jgi:formylmethanofuran dehydrogenase subunit D